MKERDHQYMEEVTPDPSNAASHEQFMRSLKAMEAFTLQHEGMPDWIPVLGLAYLVDRFCGSKVAEPVWEEARRLRHR